MRTLRRFTLGGRRGRRSKMACSNLESMSSPHETVSAPIFSPTTKRRTGRITRRQAAALAGASPHRLDLPGAHAGRSGELDLHRWTQGEREVVLDIGFGSARPVLDLARLYPEQVVVAIDVHTPGVGDLLASIDELGMDNVCVAEADVREVLALLPVASVTGVRTFYPDPWPKTRHVRRRLVATAFATELADKVRVGGWWHLATDWLPYAEHMRAQIDASGRWQGGPIERPSWRPVTRYERNAQVAQRGSTDLWFVRSAP